MLNATFGVECCYWFNLILVKLIGVWNKKWDGQCPDRIERQVMKNTYENGGINSPDVRALNKALKVKQYV